MINHDDREFYFDKNNEYSHLSASQRSWSSAPILHMYYTYFPAYQHPTHLGIPLNWGVSTNIVNLFEGELNMKCVWEELGMDFKVSETPFFTQRCYINKELQIIISIETAWVSDSSADARAQELINLIEGDLAHEPSVKKTSKTGVNSYHHVGEINFLLPPPENRDVEKVNEFISKITSWVRMNDVSSEVQAKSKIHMLVKDDYDMHFKDFDISKFTPELKHSNEIYGAGFDKFNEDLIKKLEKEKKGVVLLHGHPGTGKTHYIRTLLRQLTEIDKRVIYIPPSMVDSMTDPSLIGFLTTDIIEEERDTILLIEDAEPLLESRESSGGIRTTGISNLLNSTDGLLNDILGLVVICTFNTELKNIDSALLRPGRLMARKEFKKIPSDRVIELAKLLEIDTEKIESGKDYSIAEILNLKKESTILIHDHEDKERRQIGFGAK